MRYLLCLLILLSALSAVRGSDMPGSVIYVKLTSDAQDARSDVYEQHLGSVAARLLITHSSLPQDFKGRIESALPSSDGSLILLKESDVAIIRNPVSGSTRTVLGSGYSTIGDEVLSKQFTGGWWMWSRNNSVIKMIKAAGAHTQVESCTWSTRGRLLMMDVTNSSNNTEALWVHNAATGNMRKLYDVNELVQASWTTDSAAIFVLEQVGKSSRLMLLPMVGKPRRLLTRAGRVFSAAISPDLKTIALGDQSGFTLRKRDGRTMKKLKIPTDEGRIYAGMSFSSDGKKLAIMRTTSGEGLFTEVHETLWSVDVMTTTTRLVAKWEVTPGNSPGEDTSHQLIGWIPGQPTLLVEGRSCTLEGPATEWRKLWLRPSDATKTESLITDTGPCGIDLQWIAGK